LTLSDFLNDKFDGTTTTTGTTISKMSDEDRELLAKRTTEEIMRRITERQVKNKNKKGT
jgi:hypothetical protein